MLARRLLAVVIALLPVLSSAAACPARLPSGADGCAEGDVEGPVETPPTVAAATPGQPAPVAETLWTLDEGGRLRAADARTNTLSTVSTVTSGGAGLLAGGGAVWVYRPRDGVVTAVSGGKPVEVRTDRGLPFVGRDGLWLAGPGSLSTVDRSGALARVADLPPDFSAEAHAIAGPRVLLTDGRRLVSVDPATGGSETVPLADLAVTELVATPDGPVMAVGGATVSAVDPATGAVTASFTLSREELVFGAFAADDDVWVVTNCGRVLRLDTGLKVLDSIRVSGVSQDFPAVVAAGSLWVGDQVRSDIVRIDLATHRIVARIPVSAADPDDPFFTLETGGQSVWVLSSFAAAPLRVDPASNRIFHLGAAPPAGVPAAGDGLVAAAAGLSLP